MGSDIIGIVVTSKAGRDRGRSFVVLATAGDGRVLMADGATRKAERPKLKKLKHLKVQGARVDMSSMPEGGKGALNSYIRKSLTALGYNLQKANKEG